MQLPEPGRAPASDGEHVISDIQTDNFGLAVFFQQRKGGDTGAATGIQNSVRQQPDQVQPFQQALADLPLQDGYLVVTGRRPVEGFPDQVFVQIERGLVIHPQRLAGG